MKKTPRMQKLEEMLHSSQIVSGGFFGDDRRGMTEIIDRDAATVSSEGYTFGELAAKMKEITAEAKKGLGMWVDLPAGKHAKTDEAKGQMICPWPHPFRCDKRVTTLENEATGETVLWTDLSIHLIEEHGFFEGKGSPFRIEPAFLIRMLF
jgi:hypothetical protein